MKPVALLIVLLTNQGYWFGEQGYTVELRWAVQGGLPADVVWELSAGASRLDGGKTRLKDGDEATTVSITPPKVRARTAMTWSYRLVARDGGKELESGQRTIGVFPADLLGDVGKRVGERKLCVIENGEAMGKVLEAGKVPCTRLKDCASLQMVKADLVLVGKDTLGEDEFEQSPLMAQAGGGASVMVFAQAKARRLGGYAVVERPVPREMKWRVDHPLFLDLLAEDLPSFLSGRGTAAAVQLPADEPALEIVWWPRESPGEAPAPIDALVVSKTMGRGRLALCQLPLGAFDRDPRSAIVLRNAIDYLLSRPEPTPPPSKRGEKKPPAPTAVPTIAIP